jgi:hypothetical protein
MVLGDMINIPVCNPANVLISKVFPFLLRHHGKIFVSASYGNSILYSTGSVWANFNYFLKTK